MCGKERHSGSLTMCPTFTKRHRFKLWYTLAVFLFCLPLDACSGHLQREPRLRNVSHWRAILSWIREPVQLVPQDKPFFAVWNAPSFTCGRRYGLTMDLDRFGIVGNEFELFHGQSVNLFYESRLGFYPRYLPDGTAKYGGIPQLGNLSFHLEWVEADLDWYIPNATYDGLAIIDWESWRPLFVRNWGKKTVYREASIRQVRTHYPTWSWRRVLHEAERQFERAARIFMERTLALCRRLRPHAKWGFYLFPECYNHSPGADSCTRRTRDRNDRLSWLYRRSSALYPSIYLQDGYTSREQAGHVRGVLQEAYRVRDRFTSPHLPVIPYTRYVYSKTNRFYENFALQNSIGEAAISGAAGVVLWESSANLRTERQCKRLKKYFNSVLGPYVKTVMDWTYKCSRALCSGHGRCVSLRYANKNKSHTERVTLSRGPEIKAVKVSHISKSHSKENSEDRQSVSQPLIPNRTVGNNRKGVTKTQEITDRITTVGPNWKGVLSQTTKSFNKSNISGRFSVIPLEPTRQDLISDRTRFRLNRPNTTNSSNASFSGPKSSTDRYNFNDPSGHAQSTARSPSSSNKLYKSTSKPSPPFVKINKPSIFQVLTSSPTTRKTARPLPGVTWSSIDSHIPPKTSTTKITTTPTISERTMLTTKGKKVEKVDAELSANKQPEKNDRPSFYRPRHIPRKKGRNRTKVKVHKTKSSVNKTPKRNQQSHFRTERPVVSFFRPVSPTSPSPSHNSGKYVPKTVPPAKPQNVFPHNSKEQVYLSTSVPELVVIGVLNTGNTDISPTPSTDISSASSGNISPESSNHISPASTTDISSTYSSDMSPASSNGVSPAYSVDISSASSTSPSSSAYYGGQSVRTSPKNIVEDRTMVNDKTRASTAGRFTQDVTVKLPSMSEPVVHTSSSVPHTTPANTVGTSLRIVDTNDKRINYSENIQESQSASPVGNTDLKQKNMIYSWYPYAKTRPPIPPIPTTEGVLNKWDVSLTSTVRTTIPATKDTDNSIQTVNMDAKSDNTSVLNTITQIVIIVILNLIRVFRTGTDSSTIDSSSRALYQTLQLGSGSIEDQPPYKQADSRGQNHHHLKRGDLDTGHSLSKRSYKNKTPFLSFKDMLSDRVVRNNPHLSFAGNRPESIRLVDAVKTDPVPNEEVDERWLPTGQRKSDLVISKGRGEGDDLVTIDKVVDEGSPDDQFADYICKCYPGWTGHFCDEPV